MSHRRRRSGLVRLRSVALTAGAVLGVLCLVAVAACLVLGIRPLVVTSGSMSPTITTGSLVLARDTAATDVAVGDVVAVGLPDGGRVMHRVVHVVPAGDGSGQTVLTLKGDANGTPDSQPYVVRRVGEVGLHVPWLGYPITWLSTPLGLIGLGAAACGLLMFAFRRTPPPTGRRRRAGALVVVPMAAIVVAGTITPTQAYFTDNGTVTSGSLTTHTVQRPDSVSCSTSGNNASFAWPEKDPRYDYEIALWRDVTTDVLVSTIQVTGASLSRTYNNEADFGLSGGLIGTNQTHFFYATVRSWLSSTAAPNRWQSPDVRQSTQRVRIQVTCVIILLCSVGAPSCVA